MSQHEAGEMIPRPAPPVRHYVGLSGGKDSTALALRLMEVEPEKGWIPICTPTGDEPDAWCEHIRHVAELMGRPIVPVVNPLGLDGLICKWNALPNWWQRWCTKYLKILPTREFLAIHAPAILAVGLRDDEETRAGVDYSDVPGVSTRFPFREWGWGLAEVLDYLRARGFRQDNEVDAFFHPNKRAIPRRTDCRRCFFQTLYEWFELWRDDPATWADAERQEAETGHTFRSPGRDSWPAALCDLRREFEGGRVPAERRRDSLKAAQCRTCTL